MGEDATSKLASRATAPFVPTWQPFNLNRKQYSQQYTHVYSKRLLTLGPIVKARAKESSGGASHVDRIIELKEGVRSVATGAIVKEMSERKEVVGDFSEETQNVIDTEGNKGTSFKTIASKEDKLVLEDDSGRVILNLNAEDIADKIGDNLKKCELATGVVASVVGTVQDTGELKVEGIFLASISASSLPPVVSEESSSMTKAEVGDVKSNLDPCVLLVSGLMMGKEGGETLPLQLLTDYVSGASVEAEEKQLLGEGSGAHVCRVILCGGNVREVRESEDVKSAAEPVKQLDDFLSQLCANLPVDLIPGATDPTNAMMPQASIHPCLLPNALTYETLNTTPNPYSSRVGGVKLLGTSGQPIEDMRKYTAVVGAKGMDIDGEGVGDAVAPSEMDVLEMTLRSRHIAPTGPDSLPCYPFVDSDPFVMGNDDVPHVYFAGGCQRFETKVFEGVRLVCVPNFDSTKEAVKLNLVTREVEVLSFAL